MKTAGLSHQAIQDRMDRTQAERMDQYTLWQILGIWALVSLPMALLSWVVAPVIILYSPLHPGITYWLLMIAGMAWQFVVSLAIMYRELGTLRWSAIRRRTWLQTPRDSWSDQPNPRLYWWLLPPLLFNALVGIVLAGYLDAPVAWLFPALQQPQFTDTSRLASAEFHGQWWLLGVVLSACSSTISWARSFSSAAYCCPRCTAFLESTIGWLTPFFSVFITCINLGVSPRTS